MDHAVGVNRSFGRRGLWYFFIGSRFITVMGNLLVRFGAGGTTACGEALLTKPLIAIDTSLGTAATKPAIAAFAQFGAVEAHGVIADFTAVFAIATERAVASVAAIGIFGRNGVVARGTIDTVPFVECAIGGARVVGSQDLPHEDEELTDQAVRQSRGNRLFTVAFAEGLATHVRVRMAR